MTEQQQTIIVKNETGNAFGISSFIFGLLSIFVLSPIFVPLSVLMGIIGVMKKQLVWSIIGLVCAIIGFLTSPILLGVFGLITVGSTI